MNQINQSKEFVPSVSEIHTETNERIYNRNIPSQQLQPYLDVRPLNTKYTYLPVVEPRILQHSVPLKHYPTYNSHNVFNPGNTQSPFSGFAAAVNTESILKNQIYALQKCSQSVYVPRSNSDLYQDSFVSQTPFTNNGNEHNLLFHKEKYEQFNPNPYEKVVGVQIWSNPTRMQMHDIPDNYCMKPKNK